MDSKRTRYWTIEKAQGAVKAAFFSRWLSQPGPEAEARLRFTEIKQLISNSDGSIGDRTLSRALSGMAKAGQLRREDGANRRSPYTLIITRADRVSAFAHAEGSAIEGAGKVGGLGDSSEGWAVFGVPDILSRTYRRKFKAACLAHREELGGILDEVWGDCADAVLKPARQRVSKADYRRGEKALGQLAELCAVGALGLGYAVRFWTIVERSAPGSGRIFQQEVGVPAGPEASLTDALSAVLAHFAGRPVDEIQTAVQAEYAKLTEKLEQDGAAVQVLWETLKPREKARAGARLQAAAVLTAALTSVVHA